MTPGAPGRPDRPIQRKPRSEFQDSLIAGAGRGQVSERRVRLGEQDLGIREERVEVAGPLE